jgi:hypothetical protein
VRDRWPTQTRRHRRAQSESAAARRRSHADQIHRSLQGFRALIVLVRSVEVEKGSSLRRTHRSDDRSPP